MNFYLSMCTRVHYRGLKPSVISIDNLNPDAYTFPSRKLGVGWRIMFDTADVRSY